MPSKPQPVTTNTANSIPGWLSDASQFGVNGAEGLTGYTPYSGQGTAPLTPAQIQAINASMSNAGGPQGVARMGIPGFTGAMGFSPQQITGTSLGSMVGGLLSPYTQSQVDATNAQLDKNTAGAVNNTDNALAAQHAFGGDRQAIADADIRNQADMTKASTDAGLYSHAYDTALGTANSASQANQYAGIQGAGINLAGANAFSGLGATLGGLNMNDLQGLLSTGGTAQATNQAADTFNVGQYQQQYQSQFQRMQALAQMLGTVPHDTSGTSTKTSYTNPWLTAAGLGLGVAGLGTGAGATLGGSFLSGLFNSGSSSTPGGDQ